MKFSQLKYPAISKAMTNKTRKELLLERNMWLEHHDEKISPRVKAVLRALLDYAEQSFNYKFMDTTDESRFTMFNNLFSKALKSVDSMQQERAFFSDAIRMLTMIGDSQMGFSSKMQDTVLPAAQREESRLIIACRDRDPFHGEAVSGIAFTLLALGLIASVVNRDPSPILIAAVLLLIAKMVPSPNVVAVDGQSPSVLDELVFRNDTVKQCGRICNVMGGSINFNNRVMTLFHRGTNAALATAEAVVQRLPGAGATPVIDIAQVGRLEPYQLPENDSDDDASTSNTLRLTGN